MPGNLTVCFGGGGIKMVSGTQVDLKADVFAKRAWKIEQGCAQVLKTKL